MAFENIKDEQVRKLATTLRTSGLAASDTEAVRMAEEMSMTSRKVQKSYEDQDLRDNFASKKKYDVEAPKTISIPDGAESEDIFKQQEAVIDSSYKEVLNPNKTVNELMGETNQPLQMSDSDFQKEVFSSDEEDSSFSSLQDESEEQTSPQIREVDEDKSKEKKKSDAEKMPESNIDLSDVFNFGKR